MAARRGKGANSSWVARGSSAIAVLTFFTAEVQTRGEVFANISAPRRPCAKGFLRNYLTISEQLLQIIAHALHFYTRLRNGRAGNHHNLASVLQRIGESSHRLAHHSARPVTLNSPADSFCCDVACARLRRVAPAQRVDAAKFALPVCAALFDALKISGFADAPQHAGDFLTCSPLCRACSSRASTSRSSPAS